MIADSEVELAWIDRDTPVHDIEQYGSLSTQFMPVIVAELSQRQRRATQEAVAKERALERLHSAEQMTTLGQLAAGIAHELNNAIGVVSSKTERLESLFMELLEEVHPEASQFFDFGLLFGQKSHPVKRASVEPCLKSSINCRKTLRESWQEQCQPMNFQPIGLEIPTWRFVTGRWGVICMI